MEHGYWFKSDLFQIQKGEDEETNPGCYGKELGEWLCLKLKELEYDVEELIPEDWGWCVMCSRDEYMLWIGCGAMQTEEISEEYDPERPPKGTDVIWHVFPQIEIPFFSFKAKFLSITGKLDTKEPLNKLNTELNEILSQEPRIEFCEEP